MKTSEVQPLQHEHLGHVPSDHEGGATATLAAGHTQVWRRHAINSLIWAVLLSVVAVLFLRQVSLVAFFRFDDSYITLRYAQELERHGVLSFNPDERIDGYTSLAWTLLLAASEALGFRVSESMLTIGRFFGYASIPAGVALARLLGASWPFAIAVAAAGLVYTPGFVVWSIPGMEMPFAAFIYTALLLVMVCPRPDAVVPRLHALSYRDADRPRQEPGQPAQQPARRRA